MAAKPAKSKIAYIVLTFVLAVCGAIFGAFVAVKVSHHLQFNGGLHIAFVSLGAACGFGGVWLLYWISQNLFVEE
jgi:hypothetical protein